MATARQFPEYIRLEFTDPAFEEQMIEALNHVWSSPLGRVRIEQAHAERMTQPELTEAMMDEYGHHVAKGWRNLSPEGKQAFLARYNERRNLLVFNDEDWEANFEFPKNSVSIKPHILARGYRGYDNALHPISLPYAIYHELGHVKDPVVSWRCLAAIAQDEKYDVRMLLEVPVRFEDQAFLASESLAMRYIGDNKRYTLHKGHIPTAGVQGETDRMKHLAEAMSAQALQMREAFISETGCLTPISTPQAEKANKPEPPERG